MASTVYGVTAGEYADYEVWALFSTREKAEAYVASLPESVQGSIEEWELDPEISSRSPLIVEETVGA